MQEEEYAYKGADLAILFTNTRLKTKDEQLSPSATQFIDALRSSFEFRPHTEEEQQLVDRYNTQSSLKGASSHES